MPATSVLLLTAASGDAEALRDALAARTAALLDPAVAGVGVRVLVREPDPAPAAVTVPRAPADIFTAALVLDGGPDGGLGPLLEAADGLGGRIGAALDPARSAALAGTVHVMMEGDGPAVRLYAMRRLPRLTAAEFHDYWLRVHSEFGRRALAGQGYRQVHTDAEASKALAAAAGVAVCDFDGCVLSPAAGWDAYERRRATPEARRAGADALADEKNFIDHSRSMAMAFTESGEVL